MERLKSMAGYASLPTVDDALAYVLPPFSLASRRLVQVGQRLWELWSPNSDRVEYYPGVPEPDFSFEEEDSRNRRADGHCGRFDPTVTPQVLDPARLWFPFVRTEAPEAEYPEFSNFADVWDDRVISFKASFLQRLLARMETIAAGLDQRTGFETAHPDLWAARPRYSLREDVRTLGAVSSYYEALDRYSRVQRDAKLAAAWMKMVHAMLKFSRAKAVHLARVPPAKPGMMGAWINGSTAEDGLWLLSLGIPCYIIHERDTYWDFCSTDSSMRVHSFLTGTRTNERLQLAISADTAMREHGWELYDLDEDNGRATEERPTRFSDRVRSSSHGQGWYFGSYTGSPVPVAPLLEDSKGITPPPVASVGQGRWENWVEDRTNEGFPFMVSQGRKQERGGETYYDRDRRRVLHFDYEVRPLRHYSADPAVFGLPVPDYPFYRPVQNAEPVAAPKSSWMYLAKDPVRSDVGRVYDANVDKREHHRDTRESEDSDSEELMGPRYTPALADRMDRYTRSPVSPSRSMSTSPSRTRFPQQARRTPSRSPPPGLRRESPVRGWQTRRSPPSTRRRSPSPVRRSSGERSRCRTPERYQGRSRSREAPLSDYQRFRRQRSPDRHWRPRPSARSRSRSPARKQLAAPNRYRPLYNRFTDPPHHPRSPSPPRRPRSPAPAPVPLRSRSPVRFSPAPRPRSPARLSPAPRSRNRSRSLSRPPAVRSVLPAAASSSMLSRINPADLARLRELFPPTPTDIVPGLRRIGSESRFLAVTNLPLYYVWSDVLRWLRSGLPSIRRPRITRVLRTIEDGYQVFWVVLKTVTEAAALRGLLSERVIDDSPALRVVFADPGDYSSRASVFRDAWSPKFGMELDNRPKTEVSIYDRLALPDPRCRSFLLPPVVSAPSPKFLALDPDSDAPRPAASSRLRSPPHSRNLLSRLDAADGGAL